MAIKNLWWIIILVLGLLALLVLHWFLFRWRPKRRRNLQQQQQMQHDQENQQYVFYQQQAAPDYQVKEGYQVTQQEVPTPPPQIYNGYAPVQLQQHGRYIIPVRDSRGYNLQEAAVRNAELARIEHRDGATITNSTSCG